MCLSSHLSCRSTQQAQKVPGERLQSSFLAGLDWSTLYDPGGYGTTTFGAFVSEFQKHLDPCDLCEHLNPALLTTIAGKEDNPAFTEAMNGTDAAGFLEAMKTEIATLIRMKTFTVVKQEPWMNVISSVWAFKRKRHPDGRTRKLKARTCAQGCEAIKGADCFETCSPVVQWMSVRTVLILMIVLGSDNRQIDHAAAFMQAPIKNDVFV